MNIFYLDTDPVLAAQYQVNKHVVKMILESAQLLCTTHHLFPLKAFPEKFYKPTHKNHPSSIWVRESVSNYNWLCKHAIALCEEYTYRYDKVHASQSVIEWCRDNIPGIPDVGPTRLRLAMPDEFIDEDPVKAYRSYYTGDKKHTIKCEWKRRNAPEWFNNE